LRKAWAQPDTIIVNEPFWTATARHADIVFPSTTSIERNDFSAGPTDCFLTPMRKAVEPYEQSRSDFEIFSGLAARFGVASEFTHDRDDMGLIEKMYMETRESAAEAGVTLPDFAEFWNGEQFSVESQLTDRIFDLEKFRENADANALGTPSGKIELYSDHIASFGYDDCIGHPMWYDKSEWLGSERASEYPLHLISNQPKTRLHSQYDHAITSRTAKLKDREIVRVNPEDASARNVKDGDIVRIFNDRGACLAAVVLSEKRRHRIADRRLVRSGTPGRRQITGSSRQPECIDSRRWYIKSCARADGSQLPGRSGAVRRRLARGNYIQSTDGEFVQMRIGHVHGNNRKKVRYLPC
jgi:biotin/methionine sulfoxide reductase